MTKNVYEKWAEIDKLETTNNSNYVVDYYLSKKTLTRIYFGIKNNKKTIYLEFSSDALKNFEPINLKGLDIYVENVDIIDPYKKYIVITNVANNNEIFLAFSRSLCDELIDTTTYFDAFNSLKKVIKEYKEYFSNPNSILTLQEEQGLCAELIELKELIKKYGQKVVYNWQGPNKNKRDFVFNKNALEVKSTQSQINTNITISNENQLDNKYPNQLDKLYLNVYIFEINDIGFDVISCANNVLECIKDVYIKSAFIANLLKLKVDINIYKPKHKFKLQEKKSYLITNDFPKITKNNIDYNIFDVKYKLDIKTLSKFEVQEEELYE